MYQRVKPKLSFHHEKERVDVILDQAVRGNERWNGGFSKTHVHEAWFYLLRGEQNVRKFPEEESRG